MASWLSLFDIFRSTRRPPIQTGWLIVGIGNPGQRYRSTRHNAGFRVAEAVSRQLHGAQRYSICQSIVRIGTLPAGAEIAVAQPQTYVNRSGDAVKGLLDKFKIPNSACLIVIDDLHLPIGALRFRRSGSDGGHNGLKSIISSIGSDFPRLRVGVGPLPPGGDTVAFVLGDFDSSEKEIIATAIAKAAEAVLFFVDQGIDKAMNRYNAG